MSIGSFCKTKEAITGMSLGAVAILLIVTFVYPMVTQNADAISEIQIQNGIIATTLQNQVISNIQTGKNLEDNSDKLDKIIIILCIKEHTSLCP